jgi:uncharacterized protein YdeI (YjbR/CyaY-like superfamily)
MGRKDPRVDEYIDRARDFAKPILRHIRKIAHRGCPDVEETIKWGFPHFDYKGIMCGLAAFKQHCAFGFWKGELIFAGDADKMREAMGHFGRITALADLPDDETLTGYVRKAAELNETGAKKPGRSAVAGKKPVETKVPAYFSAALKKNRKAQTTFDKLSKSGRGEYIAWLEDAKREETRQKRLATSIEWLSEGKPHNWRYMPEYR